VLFIVDAVSGATSVDTEIGELLRRGGKPVLLLANKADNEARQEAALEFYEFSLGDPMPVSAYHGLGIREVLDRLLEISHRSTGTDVAQSRPPCCRPTLAVLHHQPSGQERVIVSEVAARLDAVDTRFV
jgi:GTP-binding protein